MGLFESIKSETVSDLACRDAILVAPSTPVRQVVELMRQANLGCAVLVDDNRNPKGVFVERQLTQLLAENPQALDAPVESQVSETWPQVSLSDPIEKVLAALMKHNTRFLPVVDDSGKVVKLTGQKGLMEFIADHYPNQVAVHRLGQKPYMQQREGA